MLIKQYIKVHSVYWILVIGSHLIRQNRYENVPRCNEVNISQSGTPFD
jgi:hypothetical protein